MTWFKVDDGLCAHPKAREAGLPAMGLWVVAGAFCGQNSTGGFVPDWYVQSWPGGRKLAAELVGAGLWIAATVDRQKGWQFHEWEQANPTREEALAKHQARVNAGQRGGVASGRSRAATKRDEANHEADASPPGEANASANAGEANEPRPVPTRTTPSLRSGVAAKRATQVPETFDVTDTLQAWAKDNGITADLQAETTKWQDHHRFKATTGKDWTASWRNWMKNTITFNRPPAAAAGGTKPYRDADYWPERR